jgi:hypothetical protein
MPDGTPLTPPLEYCTDIKTLGDTDQRYLRRYQAWNLAYEVARLKLVVEHLIANNPSTICAPVGAEIDRINEQAKKDADKLAQIFDSEWEHPTNDPDDE